MSLNGSKVVRAGVNAKGLKGVFLIAGAKEACLFGLGKWLNQLGKYLGVQRVS